jgi:xanthine dehydrogenase accessory factor
MSASSKEIHNIQAAIKECNGNYAGLALATVVDVEGSSYRRIGARMLIRDNGSWTGSISGGCLEGNVLRRAREVMRTQVPILVTYDTRSDEDARAVGASLGCNGVIKIWIEPFTATAWEMLEKLRIAFMAEESTVWVRLLTQDMDAPRAFDFLPLDECIRLGYVDPGSLASDGLISVSNLGSDFWAVEEVQPSVRLYVFGAGDDVKPLAHLAAELGWELHVSYNCAAKTLPKRFPEAQTVLHQSPADAVATMKKGKRVAAVLMSHNFDYDLEVLAAMLPNLPAYLGVLGPRNRFERLKAGLGGIALEEGHAPVGLDIGAQTPFEIALSVVAEINAALNGRKGGSLKDLKQPIHGRKYQSA